MSLSSAEFLLIVRRSQSGGAIDGRTLLQKRVYFVQRVLGEELSPFQATFLRAFCSGSRVRNGIACRTWFCQRKSSEKSWYQRAYTI